MTANYEMTEFTASDWEAFSGAEAWPNSKPLIGQVGDHAVVASRNGIDVMMMVPDGEIETYFLPVKVTPMMAQLICNTIMRAIAEAGMFDATGLGFISL